MNRVNIVRGFLIVATIATGGCLAESSPTDATSERVDEVHRTPILRHEAKDPSAGASTGFGEVVAHPTGGNLGPSPDPWRGDGTNGPSPDPWVPRARQGPSDGDPSSPESSGASTPDNTTK